MKSLVQEPTSSWGGPWTDKKLTAFTKYVRAYLNIMNRHKNWKTIYFDGFAGGGVRRTEVASSGQLGLFEMMTDIEGKERIFEGSALRVLSMEPHYRFNYYYFVDKNEERIAELRKNIASLENINDRIIEARVNDCNNQLLKLAQALQNKTYAALIFLDPFGMQIHMSSLTALKGTRSDIWILIPSGVAVNRLLDRKMVIKSKERLADFFGIEIEKIEASFYAEDASGQQSLFPQEGHSKRKVDQPIDRISSLYAERMKEIWQFVTIPMPLKNRRGVSIFHLIFGSNNPAAYKIGRYLVENTE